MIQKYVRIIMIFGMIVILCGAVNAAGMGIVAETHETSGAQAPVCSAPCECMSLTQAMQRWGADGYDYCSKTVCGQSADAMEQYYCLHQAGSTAAGAQAAPAQAPAKATPAPAATQKSPVNAVIIFAAIGVALVAAAALRRN